MLLPLTPALSQQARLASLPLEIPRPQADAMGEGQAAALSSREKGVSGVPSPLGEKERMRGDFAPLPQRARFSKRSASPRTSDGGMGALHRNAPARRRQPGARTFAYRGRDHPGRGRRDCADPARKPRNAWPDCRSGNAQRKPHRPRPARARAMGTCRGSIGRCRRPGQLRGSRRYPAPQAASPMNWPELLRQAQGKDAAKLWRAAEIVDLGVLRQMWRPSALADIPAALSRAEHAIASGEARHPAMKRIGAAEWDAARSLASQMIEALSPLIGHQPGARPCRIG